MPDAPRGGRALVALLALAVLVRLPLLPARGNEHDLAWTASCMRATVEHGATHVFERLWCDFGPGYLYVLGALGHVASIVTALPADGSAALRALVKLPALAADVALAALLYRVVAARAGRRRGLYAAAAHALSPAVIAAGVLGGGGQGVALLLEVAALVLCAGGRLAAAMAAAVAALSIELQAAVLVPLLAAVAACTRGRDGLRDLLRGGGLAALGLLGPLLLGQRLGPVIENARSLPGRWPFASVDAHGAWWLALGPAARATPDLERVGNGLLTYRDLGELALLVATGLVVARLVRALRRGEDTLAALGEAAALEGLACYLLPTQVHARDLVPALAPLLLAGASRPRLLWLHGALTAAAAGSLLGARGGSLLAALFSAGFVALFAARAGRRFLAWSLAAVAGAAALTAAAAHVPLAGPVRLCEWDPVSAEQGWGRLQRDRSVGGRRLEVDRKAFRHGLGTHAPSRLVYALGRGFSRFDAAVGVDAEAVPGRAVRFRVLADGQVRADSGPLQGGGPIVHLVADVTGADRLTLEVQDGGDGRDHDRADWIEPTLWR